MPQDITTTVKAANIKAGDRIFRSTTPAPVTVNFVKVGTKWVHVYNHLGQRMGQLPVDEEVQVVRTVLTDEDMAAKERAYTEQRVQSLLDDDSSNPATVAAEFASKVAERVASGFPDIRDSDIEGLLQQQATYAFLEKARSYLRDLTLRAERGSLPDYLQEGDSLVLAAFARAIAASMVGGSDPLNRSTNTISNLSRDLTVHTARRMLSSYGDATVLDYVHRAQAKAGPWSF